MKDYYEKVEKMSQIESMSLRDLLNLAHSGVNRLADKILYEHKKEFSDINNEVQCARDTALIIWELLGKTLAQKI